MFPVDIMLRPSSAITPSGTASDVLPTRCSGKANQQIIARDEMAALPSCVDDGPREHRSSEVQRLVFNIVWHTE